MSNFAQEKQAPIGQPVVDPSHEAGFGFGGVLVANSGVRFSRDNLNTLEQKFESSFDSGRVYHFIGLAGIHRKKCGFGKLTTAP